MGKLINMQNYLPSILKPTTNTNILAVLEAWSTEDDSIVSAIADTKEQIYVTTAQLEYLDGLASNVGVSRPSYFNMSDDLFRLLIPALSYYPKQVLPTIIAVLDIFFGEDSCTVTEMSPNEITITIPDSVVSFRRSLIGSCHIQNYNGTVTNIDDTAKTITIDLYGTTKTLVEDELADGTFGQGIEYDTILSNTAGITGVDLQFATSSDLTKFSTDVFSAIHPTYIGSHIPDELSSFTLTRFRGTLGQNITAGYSSPNLIMADSSGIPDSQGYIVLNFGKSNQESGVRYYSRPNNNLLSIDPSYVFTEDHLTGEVVNMTILPYRSPRIDGTDYSAYLVDVLAARSLAQSIIESIVAAGVIVNWIVE